MRDRMLHDALRQLTDDAARLLESRLREGAEISFEVGETGVPRQVSGTALFAYRPLTAEFVSSHADQLRTLPAFENAANHLVRTRGTIAYLRLRDEPVLDVGELTHARLGVLAFLAAVWGDAEHFEPWDDRFVVAYRELESVVLAERLVTTVFIPVHGVVLDCEVVNLGAGVELMSTEDLDADCLDRFSDAAEGADCYCSVSVDAPSNAPAPMAAVRRQARSLLTALRMFKPGSVSLGITAQANVGGAWQQASVPFTGRSREEAWRLLPGEDEELRQFIGAVRRIERRTRVAWALKRFEMGLERSVPAEGLTDFLAALRALLEAHDDTGKAALPARVSALCARDSERLHVRATVEAAFALERLAVDGHIGRADRKRLTKQPPLEVIAESERYLRALLHDLVCGYLATDLKLLADEILLADGEPTGPETAAHDPVYLEPVPDPGSPKPDPTATQEFDAVFGDTAEITAVDLRDDLDRGGDSDRAGADGELDDNVWTLRPAAEIKPAPELPPDPSFEPVAADDDVANGAFAADDEVLDAESGDDVPDARIPTYAERETDTRMRQLAEELVSDFDDAFSRTMEADAVVPEPEPGATEPRPDTPIARLFGLPPAFATPAQGEGRAPGEHVLPPPSAPEPTVTGDESANADFTFDFSVVDTPDAPYTAASREARQDRHIEIEPIAQSPDPDFPVPEFELPAGRGPAAAIGDSAVDAGLQSRDFKQIMDENFTPPARDLNERPTTPLVRDGRPHLVAIDGNSARDLEPVNPPPDGPRSTVEFDVIADFDEAEGSPIEPVWSDAFASNDPPVIEAPQPELRLAPAARLAPLPVPEPAQLTRVPDVPGTPEVSEPPARDASPPAVTGEHRPLSSEQSRTHAIGPATIEFRPLVDPDEDDPDDFAGVC